MSGGALSVLLAGATGLVGRHVLAQLLSDARFRSVVAPTRRPLAAHPKLENPLVDFDRLDREAAWWAVDAAICTLGTTRAKAGSAEAFRRVDLDYPLAVARLARAAGATRFGLNSALGADASSRLLYPRTKGEVEKLIGELGYPSLTIVRPGLIGGERGEFRAMEAIASVALGALGPVLPRRYRINPAGRIAAALVDGVAEGLPGTRVISSEMLV